MSWMEFLHFIFEWWWGQETVCTFLLFHTSIMDISGFHIANLAQCPYAYEFGFWVMARSRVLREGLARPLPLLSEELEGRWEEGMVYSSMNFWFFEERVLEVQWTGWRWRFTLCIWLMARFGNGVHFPTLLIDCLTVGHSISYVRQLLKNTSMLHLVPPGVG